MRQLSISRLQSVVTEFWRGDRVTELRARFIGLESVAGTRGAQLFVKVLPPTVIYFAAIRMAAHLSVVMEHDDRIDPLDMSLPDAIQRYALLEGVDGVKEETASSDA